MILTRLDRMVIDDYPKNIENALLYFYEHRSQILEKPLGKYPINNNFFYEIQNEGSLSQIWQSHARIISIHIILDGEEIMETNDIDHLKFSCKDKSDPLFLYYEGIAQARMELKKNNIAILFPEDGYREIANELNYVHKCTFTISINI